MAGSTIEAPPAVSPCEVFASLAGSWSLDRMVSDGASMTGVARFVPGGDRLLHYHERVLCRMANGSVLEGERRYLFAAEDDGFRVLFAGSPPRLFHRVTLHRAGPALIGAATHLCGADRYDSRYAFDADGSFAVRHDVGGPRKRYTIATRYLRRPRSLNAVAIAGPPA